MSSGRIFTLVLLAITLALAPGASAFAEDGFYAGVGVGQATIEIDDSDIDFDQDDFGWKAFAGYRFMPYFGIEGGYVDLGEPDDSILGIDIEVDADGEPQALPIRLFLDPDPHEVAVQRGKERLK